MSEEFGGFSWWDDLEYAKKRKILIGVIIALVAIIMIALIARGRSSGDPLPYVQKTYQRDSNLDEGSIQAFLAPGKSPNAVATEISAAVSPLDRRTASTGAGQTVFLQFSKRIIAISPHGDGSKILIGDYRTAHNHWFVYIGGWWGSSPGYSGGGSGNRGGGVGGGK